MMGMAGNTEDMFSKLESMRAVITEVNQQFKDPVCPFQRFYGLRSANNDMSSLS